MYSLVGGSFRGILWPLALGLCLLALPGRAGATDCGDTLRQELRDETPRELISNPANQSESSNRLLIEDRVYEPASGGLKTLELKVFAPNGSTLHRLKQPNSPDGLKSIQYVIDMNNHLHFVDPAATLDFSKMFATEIPVVSLQTKDGPVLTALKEAGDLRFQESALPKWKRVLFKTDKLEDDRFVFEKKLGFDLSDEESRSLSQQVDEAIGAQGEPMARVASVESGFDRATVYRCTDVFHGHTSGNKFLFDKLRADMSIMTANILIMTPERLDGPAVYWGLKEREPGRDYDEDMLLADYVASPMNTLMKTSAGLLLVKSGAGIGKSLGFRLGVSLASIGLQTLIYNSLTDNNAKHLGWFNMGYMLFSIGKSQVLDEWLLDQLPSLAYKSCLVNSSLRFVVSPSMVRFGEGGATTVLYYYARKKIIGQ